MPRPTPWRLSFLYHDPSGRIVPFHFDEDGPHLDASFPFETPDVEDNEKKALETHVRRRWREAGSLPDTIRMGSVSFDGEDLVARVLIE